MADGDIGTFAALSERFELPLGSYKKPKLLYCSNGGHFLRIQPDGRVDGTRDRSDPHVRLQLSARGAGEVYIRSAACGRYLAMDPGGRLYAAVSTGAPRGGSAAPSAGPHGARAPPQQLPGDECLFLERLEENHYNTYVSKAHAEQRWFVGLKKDGSSKAGPRTHGGQKAVLFLPLPAGE
ncbi:FGF1 factor, partial [Eudromia elegans]|nr:FGF1 factor [Eudromia elegans]